MLVKEHSIGCPGTKDTPADVPRGHPETGSGRGGSISNVRPDPQGEGCDPVAEPQGRHPPMEEGGCPRPCLEQPTRPGTSGNPADGISGLCRACEGLKPT